MSLYYLQKAIFELNRDPSALERFRRDAPGWAERFELSDDERVALLEHDIGLLYVLGVNGQLLMHFAAAVGFDWPAYLEAMREGLRRHGPVRAGVYAAVGDHHS